MTIDEAIDLISAYIFHKDFYKVKPETEAIALGLEALKEVKKARYGDPALDGELLPGETEE